MLQEEQNVKFEGSALSQTGLSTNQQNNSDKSINNQQYSNEQNNGQHKQSALDNINFNINSQNVARICASFSIIITVVHKLLRMISVGYLALILLFYIVSGALSVFSLICCSKASKKDAHSFVTFDQYLSGISLILLLLI